MDDNIPWCDTTLILYEVSRSNRVNVSHSDKRATQQQWVQGMTVEVLKRINGLHWHWYHASYRCIHVNNSSKGKSKSKSKRALDIRWLDGNITLHIVSILWLIIKRENWHIYKYHWYISLYDTGNQMGRYDMVMIWDKMRDEMRWDKATRCICGSMLFYSILRFSIDWNVDLSRYINW